MDLAKLQAVVLSASEVQDYAQELRDDETQDGELYENILAEETFYLLRISLAHVNCEGSTDPDLVSTYAKMPQGTAPAIILDGTGTVIDGYHRSKAALARGDTHILAYIPTRYAQSLEQGASTLLTANA